MTDDRDDRAAGGEATGSAGARPTAARRASTRRPAPTESQREEAAVELARVRDRIDALDKAIVDLLNERATLGRSAGRAKHVAGRRAVRDPEREREVLLRVAMANKGPLSQADLLSIYRRIVAATRGLEARDRTHDGRSGS